MKIFQCSAIVLELRAARHVSTLSGLRQWRLWAERKGVDGDKVIAIAHGVRTIEVIRFVAPHLDAKSEVREIESREAEDTDGVEIMSGAVDLVRTIPEGHWGVVTSGTRDLASARLRFGGLPVPKVLVTADDVVNGKPPPEPYLKGARLLGVEPTECLVIEDAPAGIQSARAGRMKVVGITSTYPESQLSTADAVVRKLSQIQVRRDGASRFAVSVG